MATSNRVKTNANQQVVNISLNGLDLENMIAKPKEKSKKSDEVGWQRNLNEPPKNTNPLRTMQKTWGASIPAFGGTARPFARRHDHPANPGIVKSFGKQCNSYSPIVSSAIQTCRRFRLSYQAYHDGD